MVGLCPAVAGARDALGRLLGCKLSILGLGRLAWAAKPVSLLCVIAMLPYMLCAFVMFHSDRSSYWLIIKELTVVSLLLCLLLYGVSLLLGQLNQMRVPDRFRLPAVSYEAITVSAIISSALGLLSLLLWLGSTRKGETQGIFVAIATLLFLGTSILLILRRRCRRPTMIYTVLIAIGVCACLVSSI